MPHQSVVPPLSSEAHAELIASYNSTPDHESRTRYHMLLLAADQHLSPRHIAPLVQRSHDVVLRVLHRYRDGGLVAVPRRTRPGPASKVTPAWQDELLRVIEDDPHQHDVHSANWTTQLLADYLSAQTGIATNQETVRRYLHRHDYVCKRPTWTVAHKAAEREDWVGKGCGARSS